MLFLPGGIAPRQRNQTRKEEGDIDDLESIVDEHYPSLFRFALSLAKNEAEAADLTQQACYRLVDRGGQIRDRRRVKSWLFTTLRREFLKTRHRGEVFVSMDGVEAAAAEEAGTVEPDVIRRADARAVMEALMAVPETFREPLILFYLDGFHYREIAEVLDVPAGTVMSRISRGKQDLKKRLSHVLSESDDSKNVIPFRPGAGES